RGGIKLQQRFRRQAKRRKVETASAIFHTTLDSPWRLSAAGQSHAYVGAVDRVSCIRRVVLSILPRLRQFDLFISDIMLLQHIGDLVIVARYMGWRNKSRNDREQHASGS